MVSSFVSTAEVPYLNIPAAMQSIDIENCNYLLSSCLHHFIALASRIIIADSTIG